jgi:hypothetical protein
VAAIEVCGVVIVELFPKVPYLKLVCATCARHRMRAGEALIAFRDFGAFTFLCSTGGQRNRTAFCKLFGTAAIVALYEEAGRPT